MTTWLLFFASAVLGGVGVRLWYGRWRKRRIASKRRVEKPNSHYSSAGVRNQLDRERWAGIEDLELHPLNREEVDRLLAIVDTLGIGALSTKERVFLDNMARPRTGAPVATAKKASPQEAQASKGTGEPDPLPRCG
ncbi:hypothetical protein ACFL3S_06185 [Gemmatimonadota bacterium]